MPGDVLSGDAPCLPYDHPAARELLRYLGRDGGLDFSLHASRSRGRWLVEIRDLDSSSGPAHGEGLTFATAWPLTGDNLARKTVKQPSPAQENLLAALATAGDRFFLHIGCHRDHWRVVLRHPPHDDAAEGDGATFEAAWQACKAAQHTDPALGRCVELTNRICYMADLIAEFAALKPVPTRSTWPGIEAAMKTMSELAGEAGDRLYGIRDEARADA